MISEFPLFLFTTLAGVAAGAYVVSVAFPVGKDAKKTWLFPLVCLVLLAVGLAGLPLHLGRPERLFVALSQPGAMIAQEAYWSIALGVILLIDLVISKTKGSSPRGLRIVGGIAALGLMLVMSNAYFVSIGVSAWASWQTFLLFILGDFAMGAALLALLESDLMKDGTYLTVSAVLSVLAAVGVVLETVHFASVGASMVLLIIGAVVVAVAAVLQFMAKSGKMSAATAAKVVFACAFVGIALARYGFYAACAL